MGYSGLVNAVLEKRNQDIQVALAEAEMQQQNIASIGKGIGAVIGNVGDMLAQGKQDSMANSLMNERMPIPRAQAVDPSMQGPADAAAAGQPGFYRGGMDELKTRMAMGQMKEQQMSVAAQRFEYEKDRNITKEAEKTRLQTDGKLQKLAGYENSYIKDMRVIQSAIEKSETPDQHRINSDAATALWRAGKKMGIEYDPPQIAPFVSPEQKQAIKDQQTLVRTAQQELMEAKTAPATSWDKARSFIGLKPDANILGIPVTFDSERTIQSAQDEYKQAQEALNGLQGSISSGTAPVTSTTSQVSSGLKPGDQRRNKTTGEIQEWDGSKWARAK